MNSQFHTPSLGDGFDLSGVEETATSNVDLSSVGSAESCQQTEESKRMQSMEHNNTTDSDVTVPSSYQANAATGTGSVSSGIFNITAHLNNNLTSNAANSQIHTPPTTMAARKQLSPSTNDSNGPAKPLSSYTLFFRDTVSAIKQQNPNCDFEDLQLIASTMWEALDPVQKDVYEKKAEAARNEYIKQRKFQKHQQDSQPSITVNSEAAAASTINCNATKDQCPQGQLNNATIASAENPEIASQTTANATPGEITTNSQSSVDQMQEANSQQTPAAPAPVRESATMELCIRDGCKKRAIMNPDWEDEYCSNECVVIHCRNVFNDWVQQNKEATSV